MSTGDESICPPRGQCVERRGDARDGPEPVRYLSGGGVKWGADQSEVEIVLLDVNRNMFIS